MASSSQKASARIRDIAGRSRDLADLIIIFDFDFEFVDGAGTGSGELETLESVDGLLFEDISWDTLDFSSAAIFECRFEFGKLRR
jgi:hypothetical protein